MEDLESRRLLSANGGGVTPPTVDPALFAPQNPRNVGTVVAFQYNEDESGTNRGLNDTFNRAEVLPLGTLPGQEDTIDVNGSMGLAFNGQNQIVTDVDTYAVDLRAGDIFDISLTGSAGNINIFYGTGTSRPGAFWFGTDINTAVSDPLTGEALYAKGSPLQTVGTAVAAQTIPEDGRYYIALAPSNTVNNYTMGLRVYRPVLEQAPIGAKQIVYVDFDGGIYPTSQISGSTLPLGMVRFDSLRENLDVLGFTDPRAVDYEALQREIVEEMRKQFATLIPNGNNGDFDSTGNPGEYGVTVLSTLECPEFSPHLRNSEYCSPDLDLTSNPLVTRILVGAEISDIGIPTVGIAESVDIGNFRPGEISVVVVDDALALSSVPLSPGVSQLNATAKFLAGVITHEAGHTFGERHTDTDNTVFNIMDSGSQQAGEAFIGVGRDGIFGTPDDMQSEFTEDEFALEGFIGYSRTAASLSFNLSTGRVGSTISGRVFNDVNRDGSGAGDDGLGGVTIFADIDGD